MITADMGLTVDADRLAEICRRHRVVSLEVFGSRARGTAKPESDVDLLVSFEPGIFPGLSFIELAEELEALFGREVDLLVRRDAERDRNEIRRASIFSVVRPLYAA
jgi:uncharacterized protein